MVRYKLILAYDGSQFAGSQRQSSKRTVQGQLEKALNKLGWSGKSVIIAGRTDAGVHASGQVVSFDLNWKHSIDDLQRALNSIMDADLAVINIQQIASTFHPRFDATSRSYVYKIFSQKVRDPVHERFAWRVWPEIDSDLLNKVALEFIGTHDFSAFGTATTTKGTTVRTVKASAWKMLNGEWQFEVQADAFLYRMVRRLVYVQVAVAQSRCSIGDVRNAIQKQSVLLSGLAPACGLTLVEVLY